MPRRHRRAKDGSAAASHASQSPFDEDDGVVDRLASAAASASLDSEWERLQGLLSGLLTVELDSRFQHEPQHANASWLVVHLTRVEDPEQNRRHLLSKRIGEALGALATLCAAAERLRLREPEHAAFWTRVFTSQMMARPLSSGDVTIWWFTRHTREREMRLKLKWSERRLEKALLTPVKTFLNSEWGSHDRLTMGDRTLLPRSMRAALCVTKTQLTAKDFELIGDVLVRRSHREATNPRRLFQASLSSLEISDTVLRADALCAIALRVFPVARSIDELRLEAIFPSGPLADTKATTKPEYLSAFKSVLAAALDASYSGRSSRSVGISLAYNALAAIHLHVLSEALRGGTRDLRSLSLKYALGSAHTTIVDLKAGVVKALEAIMFESLGPRGNADADCELDLTGRPLHHSEMAVFLRAVEDRVLASIQDIHLAVVDGKSITCQLRHSVMAPLPEGVTLGDEPNAVRPNEDYLVTAVSEQGYLRLFWPGTATVPGGDAWAEASAVCQLVVDGRPVVRSRFNRLILDGDVEGRFHGDIAARPRPGRVLGLGTAPLDVCGCDYMALLAMVGAHVRFVSMRWYRCGHRVSQPMLIGQCRRLTHLNLEGSFPLFHVDANWLGLQESLHRLETLNLGLTAAKPWIVQGFITALAQAPELRLQRLSLAQNQLSAENIQQMETLLAAAPSLELLELDSIGNSQDVETYITRRRELTRANQAVVVNATPLRARAKLALLSVAGRFCGGFALEQAVAASIFAMAEHATQRQILWHGAT